MKVIVEFPIDEGESDAEALADPQLTAEEWLATSADKLTNPSYDTVSDAIADTLSAAGLMVDESSDPTVRIER
jgi:hypothetical protein